MTMVQSVSICPICGQQGGVEECIRPLPGGRGKVMRTIHDDGGVHTWNAFSSLQNLIKGDEARSKTVLCPKCNGFGTTGCINPSKTNMEARYIVRHNGRPNCEVTDHDGRRKIWYIHFKNRNPSIECPKCHDIGTITFTGGKRLSILHDKNHSPWRCYITEQEHIEQTKKTWKSYYDDK